MTSKLHNYALGSICTDSSGTEPSVVLSAVADAELRGLGSDIRSPFAVPSGAGLSNLATLSVRTHLRIRTGLLERIACASWPSRSVKF